MRLALLIIGFVAGLACPARADDAVITPVANDFRHGVERETFSLVNQYRAANDLAPLAWSDAIAKEARGHSHDMATGDVDFGHDGFDGRVDRLKVALSGFRGAGENVLMTDDLRNVAQQAVTLWLHSPHHLRNIRGDYNFSAVGIWQDRKGALFFTQIFMKVGATTEEANSTPVPEWITPFGLLTPPQTRSRP